MRTLDSTLQSAADFMFHALAARGKGKAGEFGNDGLPGC